MSASAVARSVGVVASWLVPIGGMAYAAYQTYHWRTGRGAAVGAIAGAGTSIATGIAVGNIGFDGSEISGPLVGLMLAPVAAAGVVIVGVGVGLIARAIAGGRSRQPVSGLRRWRRR